MSANPFHSGMSLDCPPSPRPLIVHTSPRFDVVLVESIPFLRFSILEPLSFLLALNTTRRLRSFENLYIIILSYLFSTYKLPVTVLWISLRDSNF